MPGLPVVERAGHANPVQPGHGRGKAGQQLGAEVVKTFRVFFGAKQTALRFVTGFQCFGIPDTDDQQATVRIGEGAEGFVNATVFGADALEIQRAVFVRGQQGGDADGGLGGGEVKHRRRPRPVPAGI